VLGDGGQLFLLLQQFLHHAVDQLKLVGKSVSVLFKPVEKSFPKIFTFSKPLSPLLSLQAQSRYVAWHAAHVSSTFLKAAFAPAKFPFFCQFYR
jgi:hypothetical protein